MSYYSAAATGPRVYAAIYKRAYRMLKAIKEKREGLEIFSDFSEKQ